jgi:hypothetical protein
VCQEQKTVKGFMPKGRFVRFMLSDALIVPLQAVVAAKLVWYFGSISQPANAE